CGVADALPGLQLRPRPRPRLHARLQRGAAAGAAHVRPAAAWRCRRLRPGCVPRLLVLSEPCRRDRAAWSCIEAARPVRTAAATVCARVLVPRVHGVTPDSGAEYSRRPRRRL